MLWLATLAVIVQVAYNLSVMRYTLYTGETIFVGFFRLPPGLPFWPMFYMLFEIGGVWPYLSANAAVPLASVFLGRLPGIGDAGLVKGLGYRDLSLRVPASDFRRQGLQLAGTRNDSEACAGAWVSLFRHASSSRAGTPGVRSSRASSSSALHSGR